MKWMMVPFSTRFIRKNRTDSIFNMFMCSWDIHIVISSIKLTLKTRGLEEAPRLEIEI